MQHTVALFVQNAEFPGINKAVYILNINFKRLRDKLVPVTTAWCVHSLRMQERPPIWKVAANILNIVADSRHGVVLQLGVWARY